MKKNQNKMESVEAAVGFWNHRGLLTSWQACPKTELYRERVDEGILSYSALTEMILSWTGYLKIVWLYDRRAVKILNRRNGYTSEYSATEVLLIKSCYGYPQSAVRSFEYSLMEV